MRSQLIALLVAGFFALSLPGCSKKEEDTSSSSSSSSSGSGSSSTDKTYKSKNVPKKTKIDTPSTLNSSSSTAKVKPDPMATAKKVREFALRAKAAKQGPQAKTFNGPGKPNFVSESDAMGLTQAQTIMTMMQAQISMVELNLMFVDYAIQNGNLKVGANSTKQCNEAGTVEYTFTTAMYNKVVSIFTGFGMSDSDAAAMAADFESLVDTTFFGPAVQVYESELWGEAGKTLKNGTIDMSGSTSSGKECVGGALESPSDTVSWTDDLKKMSYSSTVDMGSGDSATILMTNDLTTKTSVYEQKGTMSGDTFSMYAKFNQCNAGVDNCVDFNFYYNGDFSGTVFKLEVVGRADDNGGFAITDIIMESTDYNLEFWNKEYWDSAGSLTGFYYSDDSTNDCFTSSSCTWQEITALSGSSEYETEMGSADGGVTYSYTYGWTLTAGDTTNDGEYGIFASDETDFSTENLLGLVSVESGAILSESLYFTPDSSPYSAVLVLQSIDTDGAVSYGSTSTTTLSITF